MKKTEKIMLIYCGNSKFEEKKKESNILGIYVSKFYGDLIAKYVCTGTWFFFHGSLQSLEFYTYSPEVCASHSCHTLIRDTPTDAHLAINRQVINFEIVFT